MVAECGAADACGVMRGPAGVLHASPQCMHAPGAAASAADEGFRVSSVGSLAATVLWLQVGCCRLLACRDLACGELLGMHRGTQFLPSSSRCGASGTVYACMHKYGS